MGLPWFETYTDQPNIRHTDGLRGIGLLTNIKNSPRSPPSFSTKISSPPGSGSGITAFALALFGVVVEPLRLGLGFAGTYA